MLARLVAVRARPAVEEEEERGGGGLTPLPTPDLCYQCVVSVHFGPWMRNSILCTPEQIKEDMTLSFSVFFFCCCFFFFFRSSSVGHQECNRQGENVHSWVLRTHLYTKLVCVSCVSVFSHGHPSYFRPGQGQNMVTFITESAAGAILT